MADEGDLMLGEPVDDPLLAFLDEAVVAWPTLVVARADFIAFVREKLVAKADADASTTPTTLAELRGPDLYLVFACLRGDQEAWRLFDRSYLAKVPDYVSRVDRSPAFADEIRQRLAEKLATTDAGAGRLAQYSGRGALWAWLRIAALREAHTITRGRKKSVDYDEVTLRAPDEDPEMALLKQRSAALFRKAFGEVVESLAEDERTLLRLHYLDGLTIEDVGKASRVSRASAARLLAQTRERIMNRVERALRDDLGANAPGAKSLLALVRSQLDLSIVRRFRGEDDDADK